MSRFDSNPTPMDERWTAIVERDGAAVSRFVYAVRTTGIYCRPNCPSRRPNRANVRFFDSALLAEAAGYRACRRCRPNQSAIADDTAEQVIRACRFIDESESAPSLSDIAKHVELSPYYLHRLFRKRLGITPKDYTAARRGNRLKVSLAESETVTRAIYDAGFGASGACYTQAAGILGMTPKQYQDQGSNAVVRFAIVGCNLGRLLVAVTEKGICQIALGDNDDELRADLLARLPAAKQVTPNSTLLRLLTAVVSLIESPADRSTLPLDIRGTAFQRKVWRALQAIPPGETRSYAQVARTVGRPNAVRAVASACAANSLAVAVPCHRVLRSDGSPAGYRWGLTRKTALLQREAKRHKTPRKRSRN